MINYVTYIVDVKPLMFKTGNLPEDFPDGSYEQMRYVHPLQLDGKIELGTLVFFSEAEKIVQGIGPYPSDLVRRLYSTSVLSSLTAQVPKIKEDSLSLIMLYGERLADEQGLTWNEDPESGHLRFYIHQQLDVKHYYDYVTELHELMQTSVKK